MSNIKNFSFITPTIMLIMGVLLIKTQLLLLLSKLLVTLKTIFNRISNAKAEMNISILPHKLPIMVTIARTMSDV